MWGFPNRLGAIDGKHCNIIGCQKAGSTYFNYKGFNSIILMDIADAKYRFLYADVGINGRVGDSGIWILFDLKYATEKNEINIPPAENLPFSDVVSPFTFLSDDAFALTDYMIKPYSHRLLSEKKCTSRSRRVVEKAFGILANRFRVLFAPIYREPKEATKIVLACVCLHNFLSSNVSESHSLDELSTEQIEAINTANYENISSQKRKPQQNGQRIRHALANYLWQNYILNS